MSAPGGSRENQARRRVVDDSPYQRIAGYSRAVRIGSHVVVSGTTGTPAACPLSELDLEARGEETYRQAIAALDKALHAVVELGGSVGDVVRSRVLLTPEAVWEQAARAHRERLGVVAPANTTVVVARLVGEAFLVEVELDAQVSGADAEVD